MAAAHGMTPEEFAEVCESFAADTQRLGVTALEYDDAKMRWGYVPKSIALRALAEIIESTAPAKRPQLRLNWRPVYQAVEQKYDEWRRAVGHG